jgi:hypothetical protein
VRLRSALLMVVALGLCGPNARAFDSFVPDRSEPSLYPTHANGRLHERPHVHAQRVEPGSIEVDGRLDDTVWSEIPTGWGFVEHEPDRGVPADETTVFRVAYDDDALYFAVACFERDPSSTSSTLCRRDNLQNSDLVSVYVDPYHDRTTGYNFRVNPDGSQADAYVFDDGNRDTDWDAVWTAETFRDERGWSTEMRIPFAAIRYRPADEMTWGLQVYRWMHGRGVDTGWAHWDRDDAGFVSRFGELRGLREVPAAKQVEVVPYVVARSTNPDFAGRVGDLSDFQNFGADLRYGLTADLTLNATFQPDFGQVEADPAVLNLGPFENFFDERRPFFVEGARAFQHPDFNLFYSRRIGEGGENTRIKFAGKVTGKVAGDVSVATLLATTDRTLPGRAHNPFADGDDQTWYAVTRFGKEFARGDHRVNFMQTAVLRDADARTDLDADTRRSRDAYGSGADFELTFDERAYRVQGSMVATVIDEAPVADGTPVDHEPVVGTAGQLRVGKYGGRWRGSLRGRWEGDRFDPNDAGRLAAADEMFGSFWLQRRLGGGEGDAITDGSVELSLHRKWLYAGRSVADPTDPGDTLFSYGRGVPSGGGGNVNASVQTRSRWRGWLGLWHDVEGVSKFETRFFDGVRGPLIETPARSGFWLGLNSDFRRDLVLEGEWNERTTEAGSHRRELEASLRWIQNARMNHRLSASWTTATTDAQWVGNYATADGQPGIGGVSYVFGELDSETLDLTLRSNVLFTRNQSLELYAQPFLARGSFSRPRALTRPGSYDFAPVETVLEENDDGDLVSRDFDIRDEDFRLASINLNVVYRWEYRPGSALFLVWTHARDGNLTRGSAFDDGRTFSDRFDADALFRNRPVNTFLVKLSYWWSL